MPSLGVQCRVGAAYPELVRREHLIVPVEHYEISRYGTLKTWAQQLGMMEAVQLLDATLAEEKKTDELLTKLATASVNLKAA
jgi:ferritin-like metal-binding protein YciE